MKDLLAGVALIIGTIVLVAVLIALPVMYLWNWLMPVIFGLTTITFWQALGLSMLVKFLMPTPSNSKK
jgi:hypothetical protein